MKMVCTERSQARQKKGIISLSTDTNEVPCMEEGGAPIEVSNISRVQI